jgi:hypothetical protein
MQEDTMTRQEELQCIYWDMYKDAYGIRPRGIDTSNWTEEAFVKEFDHLGRTIDENERQRKVSEEKVHHSLRCQGPCHGSSLDPRGRRFQR